MPDPILGWVQALVGWLKTPYKILIALLLLSITGLVLPDRVTDRMMIGGWVRSHRVLQWVVALGAGFYLIVWAIELIVQRIRIRRHLSTMSRDEMEVVQSFLGSNSLRTRAFIAHTATCEAMAKMGILEQRDPNLNRGRGHEVFYTMHGWVFQYLLKNPKLYSGS